MSSLRVISRPYVVISSIYCCRGHGRLRFALSARNPNLPISPPSYTSSPFVLDDSPRMGPASRANSRRTLTRVSNWNSQKSPYETLGNFLKDHFCGPALGSRLDIHLVNVTIFQIDPEEERKILAKEKKASMEHFTNTLRRHTLVLKKRDLMRKKAEEDKKRVISQLLAAEGLELDTDDDDEAV
ncbi:hypothetical protein BHE74_00014795 [Ensete ventricosum]|nr:hypothetical protein GW17_00008058 [Ensete ventricosum]RWW77079.1 hypothetical protein BHE74_00014795 [Ensete ventricosum]RZR90721.1 hypothetical protein BHM03_00018661 [Ensete ventricosum]